MNYNLISILVKFCELKFDKFKDINEQQFENIWAILVKFLGLKFVKSKDNTDFLKNMGKIKYLNIYFLI